MAVRTLALMLCLALGAALAPLLPRAAAAQSDTVAGDYDVIGFDPYASAQYRGSMRLVKSGSHWRYTGQFGSTIYDGIALYDPRNGALALQYKARPRGRDGVGLYQATGEGFTGTWTFVDDADGFVGTERWIRR